jgi:hypothetical protein
MTKDVEPKRNRGGRPKTRLGAPKSASFTARISQEIRDAMTEEAARTGRSIADVAEMWLEDARRGRASVEALLGGSKAAGALKQMASLAVLVERHVGDANANRAAQFALIEGWAMLARTALKPLLPTSLELAVTAARMNVYRSYVEAFKVSNMYYEVAEAQSESASAREIEDAAIESLNDSGMTDGDRLANLLFELERSGEFPDSKAAKAALNKVVLELRLEDEKVYRSYNFQLEWLIQQWQPKGPLTEALLNIVAAEKALQVAISEAKHEEETTTETGRQFISTMMSLATPSGLSLDDDLYMRSYPHEPWPDDR